MKKGVLLILVVTMLSFVTLNVSAEAVQDDIHLNIKATDSNGNVQTGTFNFTFNISNSASNTCNASNIVYSDSASLTTDDSGIVSYYLEDVSLNFSEQHWLCHYRDGSLQDTTQIAQSPYALSVDSEDVQPNGALNLTDISGFFDSLGSVNNRISSLFVRDINVSGNINSSGTIRASEILQDGSQVGDITGVFTDSTPYLLNGSSDAGNVSLNFDETYLNNTIDARDDFEADTNLSGVSAEGDLSGTYPGPSVAWQNANDFDSSGNVQWGNANDLGTGGSVIWGNANSLGTGGSIVWSNANDLGSGGNVIWGNADALGSNGDVNDFSNANSLDEEGNINDFSDASALGTGGSINDFSDANDLNSSGGVEDSDQLDGYDASFFMPLNKSVNGNFDFNGGFNDGGLSIEDGDLYAQTGYFYNVSTVNVSTLNVNGSQIPYLDDTYDLGNDSKRWRSLNLSEDASVGDDLFVGGTISQNGNNVLDTSTSAGGDLSGTYPEPSVVWGNADALGVNGTINDFSDASDLNSAGNINDWSGAGDLDSSGNVQWQNAFALSSSGNINDFSSANALNESGDINDFSDASDLTSSGDIDTGVVTDTELGVNVEGISTGISSGYIPFSDGSTLKEPSFSDFALYWDEFTGHLGINTDNPSYPLHVEGDAFFDGDTFVEGDLQVSSNQNLSFGDQWNIHYDTLSSRLFFEVEPIGESGFERMLSFPRAGNLNDSKFIFYDDLEIRGTANFTGNLTSQDDFCIEGGNCLSSVGGVGSWNVSGSDMFPEDLGYNVGIGTDSPGSLLDVNGTTDVRGDLTIRGNHSSRKRITSSQFRGGAAMEFQTEDHNGNLATRMVLRGGLGDRDIEFLSGPSGSEGVNMVVEGSSGNLGVGTTSPSSKLDVNGSINLPDSGTYQMNEQDFLESNLSQTSIALGTSTMDPDNSFGSMAFGSGAGSGITGNNAVSIGITAGQNSGGDFVASGYSSGTGAGSEFVAIGDGAGDTSGSNFSSLGANAGVNQGDGFTALGHKSADSNLGSIPSEINDFVAIGRQSAPQYDGHFVLQQSNLNSAPLIQGNFSSGEVNITGNVTSDTDFCISGGNCLSSVSGGGGSGNWDVSGNSLFPADLDNSVGIGTESPDELLEINGTGANVKINTFGDSSAGYELWDGDNGEGIVMLDAVGDGTGKVGRLLLADARGQSGSNHVKITGNSSDDSYFDIRNVGIGTRRPNETLHVNGDTLTQHLSVGKPLNNRTDHRQNDFYVNGTVGASTLFLERDANSTAFSLGDIHNNDNRRAKNIMFSGQVGDNAEILLPPYTCDLSGREYKFKAEGGPYDITIDPNGASGGVDGQTFYQMTNANEAVTIVAEPCGMADPGWMITGEYNATGTL